jgi:flagellar basal body-associated protein FliL
MAEGKGNGLKVVIIILLMIIILAVGFGGAYFWLSKKTNSGDSNKNIVVVTKANDASSYTYNMDEFLVNLADEGGKRYFKGTIYIGYESTKKEDMDKEFEEKKPILRDAMNSVLRSKTSADIASQKNIEALKKELLTRIDSYFTKGKVNNIYFYDILVQ